MGKIDLGDLAFARVEDVRRVLTTGAWDRSLGDRKRLLHWLAVALGAGAIADRPLTRMIRAALGEEEWGIVVRLGKEATAVPFTDMIIAQQALNLRVREFHAKGRLEIDLEASAAAHDRFARNYARHLRQRHGRTASNEQLTAELTHLEDDEYRDAILRWYHSSDLQGPMEVAE